MFGLSRQERATRIAVKAAWPLVAQFRLFARQVPDELWSNPYALGVLTTTMGMLTKLRFGDKLTPRESGMCLLKAYGEISGRDPMPIVQTLNTFMYGNHPSFMQGVTNAEKIIAVSFGKTYFNDDPDVVKAFAVADDPRATVDFGRGPGTREERAAGWLMVELFHKRVSRELGLDRAA